MPISSGTSAAFTKLARQLAIAIGVCSFAVEANAATYYVSQSGSDRNSCSAARSEATPKLTIATAVMCLTPGDTLYLRGGTYSGTTNVIDSQLFPIPSGASWSAPITIAGYPGESVIIRPPNNTHGLRLTTGAPSYLIFQDFTLDGVNDSTDREGIYLSAGAHHNRFLRVEIKNMSNFGVVVSDTTGASPFNEFLDCNVHDNGNPAGTERTRGHGYYVTTHDTLIDGGEIHDNEGYGVHLYDDAGSFDVNNNIVRNVRIYRNVAAGHSAGYAIVTAWGANNLIYNNLIYDNKGGVQVYTNAANTQIFNNTIFRNTPLEGIALQYYRSAPVVRNNIVYGNGSAIADYAGGAAQSHNVTSNPLFVNTGSLDFRLQEVSPARDVGTVIAAVQSDYEGVARPQGGVYDAGAFEFRTQTSGEPASPPPPPTNVRLLVK